MNKRQSLYDGFTLVEMTVVLLLITLLASVAVRETAELGFQTRYEQTKERLEMIKQAILGNSKQIINGQQAVSGFVADMGRLPGSIRELIQRSGDCSDDAGDVSETECLNLVTPGTWTASAWNNNSVSKVDSSTRLRYGWNGPYLDISGSPADYDALTDGWGRSAQGYCNPPIANPQTVMVSTNCPDTTEANWINQVNDFNYGWYFNQWTADNLTILSYGKNHEYGGSNYDADYPDPASQTVVKNQDWRVDISSGITLQVRGQRFSLDSHCSNATYTKKMDCESHSGIWYGGCSESSYANKTTCETATKTWNSCSLTAYTTQADCETNQGIWYGEGFGCTTDATKLDKASCGSINWNSCSDKTKTTQADCEITAPSGNWFGNGDNNEARLLHLCIYYRQNGHINPIQSTATIIENNNLQTLAFSFPANTTLNIGEAKLGLYYQSSCNGVPIPYPYTQDKKSISLTVYPRMIFPMINW